MASCHAWLDATPAGLASGATGHALRTPTPVLALLEAMRLASKLALAFLPVIALGFTVNFALSTRWHAAIYEADVQRDLQVLGRGLRLAASASWRDHGSERAVRLR